VVNRLRFLVDRFVHRDYIKFGLISIDFCVLTAAFSEPSPFLQTGSQRSFTHHLLCFNAFLWKIMAQCNIPDPPWVAHVYIAVQPANVKKIYVNKRRPRNE